ncbi:hypothetical protein BGZ97_009319 [Linnemannia gamsii]|uniref:Uncharacterized protein n=1 Tax=Linnemannia gamsii TaxID=64522 RepID=A0A9P6RCI2_9FUNG|nr:hypothetical protein BGZ97_009319 [Linnemannia gamsii]
MSLASPTSPTQPPALNMATKPKRSVSFMHHATVTDINDSSSPSSDTNNNTTVVLTGAPGNVNRSSFRPGRRPGYVRKGPVQSDSDASDNESEGIEDEEEEEEEDEEEGEKKTNGGIKNGIGAFSSTKPSSVGGVAIAVASTSTSASAKSTKVGVVRPGQNYVRRAPVNSDTESDEEKVDEPTRSATAPISTLTPAAALNNNNGGNKVQEDDEEENSDTDNEGKTNGGGGVGGLVRPMAQTRIAGPGQNYVRKAPVNSDSEDDDSDDDNTTKQKASKSTPAVNSPAPQQQQQQPPHSGGSIHNRHLNTALGATGPGGSVPHSRSSSYDPYSVAAAGIIGGIGGMSSAMSSPRSGPIATSTTSPYGYSNNSPYTPPAATLGMTINNTSNSSLGNFSSSNNSSNPHLAAQSVGSSPQAMAAAGVANSMAIYHQQQQEMMMIMQQQQLQIATMQQQQQAYQLIVLQQQQQHQQQLQAVHQQHSRAASANGSVHTIDTNTTSKVNSTATAATASDSDDDVPLGEKQTQLPQLPQLPSLPQFSSLVMGSSSSFSSPSSPTIAATTITPASPNAYSPRLSVQQSPLLQHNRQISTSSVHSLVNNGGAAAYLHQPISSSPLNPATSNASISASLLGGGGQPQVYGGGHSLSQTSSQPRLSDFIEEEQERLIREQHLQATAAALGGHSVTSTPTSFNGGTSLLTSSFPAGYRGSVASVMSLQQGSGGIDRGSMTSLHSAGSNGSGGSGGSGGGAGGQHRPTGSRDSFLPQMGPTLLQQQQYLTQQQHHQYHPQQQQHFPYQQQATLIHVEAKPPPPSAGLVGAISAMERDKKLAKAHGTNQLQFQHQQHQQQAMMNVEKERWLQEQRRLAWEAGQFPQQQFQQQQGQFVQQGQVYYQQQQPMMMMQVPMHHQQGWTSADEEDDDRPLGTAH